MLSVQGLPLPPFSVQSLLGTPQGKSPRGGWEVLGWETHLKGSREEPEMSHLQNCGHRRFFQSMVRTSPVSPWDSLSSTASSGGLSRFFPRNISRMETIGCKQAPHAVNSGTEIL